MKVDKYAHSVVFHGEESEVLKVRYDNRGEPYRQGVALDFECDGKHIGVFLEAQEVAALRDLLCKLYPGKGAT